MSRAIILVMDSFGIGSAPDADLFGDQGADTLGHIAAGCAAGRGDLDGVRSGPLRLPNLTALGLGQAATLATGRPPVGLEATPSKGFWGAARERSKGKDTPSGHWEMAGVPVLFDWGYFPREVPTFPQALTDALAARFDLPGFLGNCHASGTDIIRDLGDEHRATGKPIIYTSADSVFQIAAHEESFGLDRLYEVCLGARELVDAYNVGRVIARPFRGETPDSYARTGNRRDYSVPPPAPTLLDRLSAAGRAVISVGKIGDIFAHSGTGRVVKADGNAALWDATLRGLSDLPDGGLLITNFVDFDMLYGHRRDLVGYAAALEAFDARLPDLFAALRPGDLVVITADHGCDPTWPGTDHTREYVPVLAFGPEAGAGSIGVRESFADISATLSDHLGLPAGKAGRSWASQRIPVEAGAV
jgi:phosphopentomutase